jgi:hypothetical protein
MSISFPVYFFSFLAYPNVSLVVVTPFLFLHSFYLWMWLSKFTFGWLPLCCPHSHLNIAVGEFQSKFRCGHGITSKFRWGGGMQCTNPSSTFGYPNLVFDAGHSRLPYL